MAHANILHELNVELQRLQELELDLRNTVIGIKTPTSLTL